MNKELIKQLESTIEDCAKKAKTTDSVAALQFTQAALNAAHVIVMLSNLLKG